MRPAPPRLAPLLAILALVVAPMPARAQATPYVPPDDPAYHDVDVLVAHRLVTGPVQGQRPWSRATFARAAREARAALRSAEDAAPPPPARITEALARLEAHFADEIRHLACREGGDAAREAGECPPPGTGLRPRRIEVTATGADVPVRAARSNVQPGQENDITLAPPLQRNGGRVLLDGPTFAAETTVDLQLGGTLAGQFTPRLWGSPDPPPGASEFDGQVLSGYLRTTWGKAAIDAGRVPTLHGYASDLSPVFSTHPRPLTMIRVANERPGRLPWIFGGLGPASFRFGLATMGDERDTLGSVLTMLEAHIRPHPNLELGAALLAEQGGEGAPEAEWWERVVDTFGFILYRRPFHLLEDRGTFSNKLLGLNGRWHLPGSPWSLHVEFTTEDDHNLFVDPVQGAWQNAAWVWGAAARGIGPEGRLDVRLDVVHNGPIVASHSAFTSGLTVDGRPLGSPLGPEAAGVQGAVAWVGASHRLELLGAWERYSGDDYERDPETGRGRVKVADNPDEERLRVEVRWAGGLGMDGWLTRARLGASRIVHPGFVPGERTASWGEFGVVYRW